MIRTDHSKSMGLFRKYFENVTEAPEECEDIESKNTLQLYWYVVRTFFWKIILLNMLFVATCIPVITIPASIAAMSRICMKWLMGQHVDLKDDYFAEFKASFWKSWMFVLLAVFMVGLLIVACFAYYSLLNGVLMTIIMILCLIWAFWIFSLGCYAFSMQASTDLSTMAIIKNSVLLSVIAFPTTLLLAVLPGVVYFVCALFFPVTLPLLIFGIISFAQLGVCAITLKPIIKHVLCS